MQQQTLSLMFAVSKSEMFKWIYQTPMWHQHRFIVHFRFVWTNPKSSFRQSGSDIDNNAAFLQHHEAMPTRVPHPHHSRLVDHARPVPAKWGVILPDWSWPSTSPACLVLLEITAPSKAAGVGHLLLLGRESGHLPYWLAVGGRKRRSPTYLARGRGQGITYLPGWGMWVRRFIVHGRMTALNRMTDAYENITFPRTTYVVGNYWVLF